MSEPTQEPGGAPERPDPVDAVAGAGAEDVWAAATGRDRSAAGPGDTADATTSDRTWRATEAGAAAGTGRAGDGWRAATDDPAAGGESLHDAWSEVGRRFQDLGRVLRSHLEPESPDAASWTPPPEEDPARNRLDDQWTDAGEAVRRVARTAQQLATQVGEAARDPVVRDSAAEAARALAAAVSRAAEDFGEQLRQNVGSPRWSDPARPRPEPEPPVTPVRPEDDRPTGGGPAGSR